MSALHALVTGAASGIGRAIALELAEAGWTLTVLDLQREALERTASEARAAGGEATVVVADLAVPGAAASAVADAWERAPLDGLVNAAAIYPAIPFLSLEEDSWDRVQAVNVRAAVFATQELGRLAAAAGRAPAVVNVASGAARRARPGTAHYSTSKAALVMATQASAIELGAFGIRVNAVSPGFFAVDSVVNPVTEEYRRLLSETVLPGPADPRAVASVVLFLLGPGARWVNGAVVPVDGGSSAGTRSLPAHWDAVTAWQAGDDGKEGER